GSLLRMGSHPVGVGLHLKHSEGLRRHGRPIRARTVLADVAQLTRLPTVAQERRYLATKAEDVEDWAVAVITFEDGTKATVHSNDTTLGGVRNVVTAYLTTGVIQANINPTPTVAGSATTTSSSTRRICTSRCPPARARRSATGTGGSAPTGSSCSCPARAPTSVSASSTPTAARRRSRATASGSSRSTSGITGGRRR